MSITTGQFIGTSPTQVFTASGICSITTLWLYNHSDTEDVTIQIWLVKNGSSPSDENKIAEFQIVTKDSFYTDLERFVLDENDSLYVQCNLDNTVSCVLSYVMKD